MSGFTEAPPQHLRRVDLLFLAAFTFIVFAWALIVPRTLNIHETIGCVNTREMIASGDLIIPTHGGRPWLERPPLPFWVNSGVILATDGVNKDWAYRIPPILFAVIGVLLTSWIGSMIFGRIAGIVSGCVLATTYEYFTYAKVPESDIFLAAIVIGAVAMFVRSEVSATPGDGRRFLGRRHWPVLGFFVLLGATNLTKGLLFGTLHVMVPIASYLLMARSWTRIQRYLWLWGWLAFLVVGGAWAFLAYQRYPGILDLWHSDYFGRLKEGLYPNPWWYYFANLPGIVFPWTIPAFAGLCLAHPFRRQTAIGSVWTGGRLFICCWAIMPILFFSLSDGKHHHYLIPCLPPWAILASVGIRYLWTRLQSAPRWIRQPILAGLVSAAVVVPAVLLLGRKLPGPEWRIPAIMISVPVFITLLWWAICHRSARVAFAGTLALAVIFQWSVGYYHATYLDHYRDDLDFVRKTCALVPEDKPILVMQDYGPLGNSWFVHYSQGRMRILHNETFLLDDRITSMDVYVVARADLEPKIAEYGKTELVLQSVHTRRETSPAQRFTLYRLYFRDGLVRKSANVYISPMQAVGRSPGPQLE